jgi:F0F1-type ATP synthase membrane subunit b/b'
MSDEAFRWVITAAVILSALCFLVMGIAAIVIMEVVSKLRAKIEATLARANPILETVKRLADENAPKISDIATSAKLIAANAKDVSIVAKDQAHRWGEVGRDLADRTKAQVARVDSAVDETVDHVQHAGEHVKGAVMKPVREASGILSGIRAGVSAYVQGRRPSVDHATQDEEMFI